MAMFTDLKLIGVYDVKFFRVPLRVITPILHWLSLSSHVSVAMSGCSHRSAVSHRLAVSSHVSMFTPILHRSCTDPALAVSSHVSPQDVHTDPAGIFISCITVIYL